MGGCGPVRIRNICKRFREKIREDTGQGRLRIFLEFFMNWWYIYRAKAKVYPGVIKEIFQAGQHPAGPQ